MSKHSEAENYLEELNSRVRPTALAAHQRLVELGCESYVKTIYIGYDVNGEMVAALYGHADDVEIALALDEDAEGRLLADAKHLTWRSLPVAAVLSELGDVNEFGELAKVACDRVRAGIHTVNRDNDFFERSSSERAPRSRPST